MKAILYVRISELTDATTSPERQRADCQAYAERVGLEVVDIFEDLDVSGTKDLEKRPGLQAALAAIGDGRASYLVAAKIDRVARSVVTFNRVVQALQEAGGALVSVAEGLDFGTPAGRMIANVLAVFAQFESETIGARVASAKKHLQEQGKWPGGRRPFGWRPEPHESGKGYVLRLDPVESEVLADMARRAIAGESAHAIARHLNSEGITTALGKQWWPRTVIQCLSKKSIVGHGGAERLLDDETFLRLRRALEQSPRGPRTKHDHDEVLLTRELLSCSCGEPMRVATRSDRIGPKDPATGKRAAVPVRVYRCASRGAPGTGQSCLQTVKAEAVDAVVEERILDAFGTFAAAAIQEPDLVDPASEEREEIMARMTELEHDRYVRGMFSGDEGASRFARIYGDLEARLAALPAPYVPSLREGIVQEVGASFAETWRASDIEGRRYLLESMVEGIVVSPPEKRGNRFDPSRVDVVLRYD